MGHRHHLCTAASGCAWALWLHEPKQNGDFLQCASRPHTLDLGVAGGGGVICQLVSLAGGEVGILVSRIILGWSGHNPLSVILVKLLTLPLGISWAFHGLEGPPGIS